MTSNKAQTEISCVLNIITIHPEITYKVLRVNKLSIFCHAYLHIHASTYIVQLCNPPPPPGSVFMHKFA